jgi:hypothetical protein
MVCLGVAVVEVESLQYCVVAAAVRSGDAIWVLIVTRCEARSGVLSHGPLPPQKAPPSAANHSTSINPTT